MSNSAVMSTLFSGASGFSGSGGGGGSTAYGMAYRSAAFNIAADAWTDVPLNGGNANLFNVSHSTVTNPERVTVNATGVYEVSYKIHVKRQEGVHHTVSRLYKNSASEVLGSYSQLALVSADGNETGKNHGTILVSLNSGDYLTIQAATNVDVTNEVDIYISSGPEANLPTPTTNITAIMTVKKIA